MPIQKCQMLNWPDSDLWMFDEIKLLAINESRTHSAMTRLLIALALRQLKAGVPLLEYREPAPPVKVKRPSAA